MYNKNDPLVNSVKAIMEQNEHRRRVEAKLCEELGIYSRKQLPHEHQANYDALLKQRLDEETDKQYMMRFMPGEPRKKAAKLSSKDEQDPNVPNSLASYRNKKYKAATKNLRKEELVGNQHKIDANKNNRVDAHDFKLLRAKKEMSEQDRSSSDPDFAAPGDPRAPKYKDEIKYKPEQPKTEMPKNHPMPPRRPPNLEETSHKRLDELSLDKINAARKEAMKRKEMADKGDSPVDKKYSERYGKYVELAKRRMKSKMDEEKATPAQQKKVEKVMGEFKKGELNSGSKEGPEVTSRKQAVAIALSQAGLSKKKVDVKEDIDSIKEEIARTLFSKMNHLYETNDEAGLQSFIESLTEEQISIISERAGMEGVGSLAADYVSRGLGWLSRRARDFSNYTKPTPPARPATTAPAPAATQQSSAPASAERPTTTAPAPAAAAPAAQQAPAPVRPAPAATPAPATTTARPATPIPAARPQGPVSMRTPAGTAALSAAGIRPAAPTGSGEIDQITGEPKSDAKDLNALARDRARELSGSASPSPARPAASAPSPAARPAAATRPTAPAAKEENPYEKYGANDPEARPEAFFRADKEARARGMFKESMSLTSTINKVLKG